MIYHPRILKRALKITPSKLGRLSGTSASAVRRVCNDQRVSATARTKIIRTLIRLIHERQREADL